MNRYRFYFKKDFGQNFLIDDAAVERIVDALELSGQDIVLEVAPDRALTELLVQRLIL
jgi:16S rRNA (adenine1518-N6/adenine1519-N6)-dimethyltransferase